MRPATSGEPAAGARPGNPGRRRLLVRASVGLLVLLAVLPALPGVGDATLFTLTLMLTSVAVAVNWNLTGGFTGYVDFGHAVWFGIGAYTTAILMSLQTNGPQIGWSAPPAIILGAVVAGVLAAAIGRATMRLKGPYFSIALLGTFVAVREIVRVSGGITGGGVGLTLPPYLNRPLFYYIELALVAGLVALTWWLRGTRFGAALVAIREDEVGAETRGINTTRLKVTVFSFAGFSTGLFGGLWAYQNTFVDPDIAFVEVRTIDAVMGTMLGGLGTVAGPVVGTVGLFWLREFLWTHLLDYHLIAQGVLLIVIVLFLPRGLVGIIDPRGTSVTALWRRWVGRSARPDEPERDP
ncbi:MAG: branched-chain amino acid ABC transporter permease [bacterium]|nr:branched-chain amino acid ABC transporter permease [bacterium]MDE0375293.1 branched-chain amino acid ABC transporter permease [bacterium]